MCDSTVHRISGGGKNMLVIISLFGFIFFDTVYIMAIANYYVQSELIIYVLYELSVKIVQRDIPIDDAKISSFIVSNVQILFLIGDQF